jgi:hypothetical protein
MSESNEGTSRPSARGTMNDQSERHSASSMSHSPHQAASQNDQSLANAGNHEFENTNTNNNNNILKVYIYTTCGRKSTSRDGSPHAEQDRNSHEEGGQGQDTRPAHNRPNDFAHHHSVADSRPGPTHQQHSFASAHGNNGYNAANGGLQPGPGSARGPQSYPHSHHPGYGSLNNYHPQGHSSGFTFAPGQPYFSSDQAYAAGQSHETMSGPPRSTANAFHNNFAFGGFPYSTTQHDRRQTGPSSYMQQQVPFGGYLTNMDPSLQLPMNQQQAASLPVRPQYQMKFANHAQAEAAKHLRHVGWRPPVGHP